MKLYYSHTMKLSKANIWLRGPAFLLEDEENWPSRKPVPNDEVLDDTATVGLMQTLALIGLRIKKNTDFLGIERRCTR